MSRQDLRDEYKETEGHPAVKARIRQLAAADAPQTACWRTPRKPRWLSPTRTSLRWPSNIVREMPAPVVVAKGRNLLAQQIKQVARWHGIPLVENPPLAHALYRAVEVGSRFLPSSTPW